MTQPFFTPDPSWLAPKGKRGARAKSDKTFTTVWDRYSTITIENQRVSMSQLVGRYGDGDNEARPFRDYEGSPHWTINKRGDFKEFGERMPAKTKKAEITQTEIDWYVKNQERLQEILAEESVIIKVKVGAQDALEMFPKYDTKNNVKPGETADFMKLGSKKAVKAMKKLTSQIETMKKDDGGFGTFFHEAAIEKAKKAAERGKKVIKKYNEELDCMLADDEISEARKFFKK